MQVLSREEATKVERPAFPEPWKWPDAASVALSNSYEIIGPSYRKAPNGDPLELALVVRVFETLYEAGYVLARIDLEAAFVEGYRRGTIGNAIPREFEFAPEEREAFGAGAWFGQAELEDGTLAAILLNDGVAGVETRIRRAFAQWQKEQKATVGAKP